MIDLPALLISVLLTAVLVIGIRMSVTFNAFMVAIKLAVVFLIIAVGVFYIDPRNWQPFAPMAIPVSVSSARQSWDSRARAANR